MGLGLSWPLTVFRQFFITRPNQLFGKLAFKIFNVSNHYSDKLDVTDETKNQIEAELKAAHIMIKGLSLPNKFFRICA